MKKPEVQKHFLALMDRPGDCVLIDVSKLDIANGYNPNTLAELDAFTMYFSKPELLDAIKRANMANQRYLNGTMVIQDNQKHNPIEVIDRDFYDNFRIDLFLKDKMFDKNASNMIINKFSAIVKDATLTENFKKAMRMNDLDEACNILFELPYLIQRKLIVYLIEWHNKEKKLERDQELIRDKAA